MKKTEFYKLLSVPYCRLLGIVRYRLIRRFGSQKAVAKYLGIDPANLSRILTGVHKPSSLLFFHLLVLAEMDITDEHDVTPAPLRNLED